MDRLIKEKLWIEKTSPKQIRAYADKMRWRWVAFWMMKRKELRAQRRRQERRHITR